ELGDKRSPWEFEHLDTRELVAEDYVYALKRHASPKVAAPVFGVFSEYVIGLKEYGKTLREANQQLLKGLPDTLRDKPFLDLRKYTLAGAEAIDKYTLRIRIKGKYPQWKYWMAMPFVAPMPWEADAFYAQPGMSDNGLSLNQWPVGTGPFMMTEYVQDRRHVMQRNPHFRGEDYPCAGSAEDEKAGLLADCGQRIPFVDTIVSSIEKEAVPQKEKFKQGYLDVPEIEQTSWGVALRVDMEDSEDVRRLYEQRGFKLPQTTDISSSYLGFNWLDPVVGQGDTPAQQAKNRKLRQALSIAIDWEEGYTSIFRSRGGEAAHGPLPAGLFGSRHGTVEGHNPVTHKVVDGVVVRRSVAEAKQLLAEAGYPNGRDAVSGKPLVLNYDFGSALTPDVKPGLDWMVKQFAKLGVQLEVRATDYNQFQDKMKKGQQQIFTWGWLADYPDAENFLFLLYGPNAKAKFDGENASNYENPEYDRLYRRLQTLDDGPDKQRLIDKMVTLLRHDAPWAWGYFPYAALAFQPWVYNGKPGLMIRDMAKYYRVDPALRVQKQAEWNRPVWWPVLLLLGLGVVLVALTRRSYSARERATARSPIDQAKAQVVQR
ncbi:MAG: ABC transporter substrate-binding protein, partial [Burkholderiaceae bacterium]|nr:ABC transporter substrate-binding protein [Burkholderiaceae bacterium]